MGAYDFLSEFDSWEKSALMCCESCTESDFEQPIRDCPTCGEALCYDCAEKHAGEDCEEPDDDDDYDDDDDDDFDSGGDLEEWEDDDEEE